MNSTYLHIKVICDPSFDIHRYRVVAINLTIYIHKPTGSQYIVQDKKRCHFKCIVRTKILTYPMLKSDNPNGRKSSLTTGKQISAIFGEPFPPFKYFFSQVYSYHKYNCVRGVEILFNKESLWGYFVIGLKG